MNRKKIIAGNWKMNLARREAIELAAGVARGLRDMQQFNALSNEIIPGYRAIPLTSKVKLTKKDPCRVILIPSFVYLSEIKKALAGTKVHIGAQNCSNKENGALTGEVSAAQLESAGAEYVIIGHSERREHFGEGNAVLKDKLAIALKYGLKPIFCCGEPLKVRESNQEEHYVQKQLEESLFPFSENELEQIVIAYEPVWAIGTGLNATAEQAQQMHAFIRGTIQSKYGASAAQQMRILYGGSCKPSNAKELFSCPDVDGGLIGGASLVAKDFLAIIAAAQ